MPPSKQPTPYDTIFDFIFASRKQKPGKKKPGPEIKMTELSGLAVSYAEIATKPWLYPVDQILGSVQAEINSLGGIVDWRMAGRTKFSEYAAKKKIKIGSKEYDALVSDMGSVDDLRFRVRGGEASSFLNNPRGYIDGAFKKYKAGRKWSTFGGFTKIMSAAQFGLWAKSMGVDTATSVDVGLMMAGSNRTVSARGSVGRALGAIHSEVGTKYGISRDSINQAIKNSQGQEDKSDKFRDASNELMASTPGLSRIHAERTASRIWGKKGDDNDLGLAGMEYNNFAKTSLIRKLKTEAARARASGDRKKSKQIMNLVGGIQNIGGTWGVLSGGPFVLGQAVGKFGFGARWIKDYLGSGVAFGAIVSGGMFSGGLGNTVFNVLKGSGDIKLVDSAGKVIKKIDKATGMLRDQTDTMLVAANTPQGKLFSRLYYLHPVNTVKGLIWDGHIWKRWAFDKKKGVLSANSTFYKIFQMMPKTLLSRGQEWFTEALSKKIWEKVKYRMAKVAVKIAQKFFKDALKGMAKQLSKMAFKEMIKKILVTVLTQVLGSAVPVVGNVAAILVDVALSVVVWIGEKLLKPFLELLALIVLGGLALLSVGIFGGLFGDDGTQYLQRHLSPPVTGSAGEDISTPVDWSDDPVPPHYDGTCPAGGGALRCTQGSHGSVSTFHRKTRAVDFGLAPGTPIYAPHNGVIIQSRAVSKCSDGTNYGGTIVLQEKNVDGSSGYTWTFYHLRPSVSQGQTVKRGDLIGRIDGPSTADYSNICWTGPHIHIHVKNSSGAYLDSEVVLHAIGCNFTCYN